MGVRLIGGLVGLVIVVVLAQTFVFGGGGGLPSSTGGRSGTIPTATPPAQLPDPILLGSSSGATGPSGSNATAGTTYTVQPGDTLGTIATNFKVPAAQQAQWIADVLRLNGLADARLLQAGQVLNLPGVPAASATTPTGSSGSQPTATLPAGAPTPKATATITTAGGSGDTYKVVDGDNPYVIADKFCVASAAPWVNELLALNNIDASNLRIGQVLQLPQGTPAQCKQ